MPGDVVDPGELREGGEVVDAGLLRELDDPSAGGDLGAGRVERHVAVPGAGGEDEEVDPTGLRQALIVGGGVGGVGQPHVLVGDLPGGRHPGVEDRLDLLVGEPAAGVVDVGGDGAPGVAVGNHVVVHHRDHEAAQVEISLGELTAEGVVRRRGGAPSRAAEQKGASTTQRRFGAGGDLGGQGLPERCAVGEDAPGG